jgi:arylsulfatase
MALYQDTTIPIPVTATDEAFRRLPPFIANEKNEGRNRWRWRFDTPEKYQSMMKKLLPPRHRGRHGVRTGD